MTTLKPIEKWKFNLQIVLAIILMFIYCCQGVLYIILELAEIRMKFPRDILSYATSIIEIVLLAFQTILFRPYPRLKNLLVTIIILRGFFTLKNIMLRSVMVNIEFAQVIGLVDGLMDLVMAVINIIFLANMLTRKFNHVPLVKMFRTYAIISIFMVAFDFVFSSFYPVLGLIHIGLMKIWVIIYFILPVPYLFLILTYQKVKTIYATLVEGKYEEPAENWPPPSTI